MTDTAQSANSAGSAIVFNAATNVDDRNLPAGVPEGRVEKTDPNSPEDMAAYIDHEEVIVHDKDEDGNVIGWHKAPAGE